MEKAGTQSTQNLFIDYEVAGLGDRIGAYLLDSLITGAYFAALIFYNTQLMELPAWLNILLIMPPFFYHLFCEIFLNGQSLGKKQLNIKVVRLDGTQPGLGNYLLRWLLRPIDIWLYGSVAIITILVNGRGQRVGDLLAGTTVVKYGEHHQEPEPQLSESLQEEEAYQLQFPQVSSLSQQEIAQIRETLRNYRLSADTYPVKEMSDKMQQRLSIQTSMPPLALLDALLKDYEYIRTRS